MKNFVFLFLIALIAYFSSCSDFIEPSLENQTLKLIAPTDGLETSNYQFIFWWETNNDALRYKLQIVSKNFNVIEKVVLDTIVKGDKFTYTLEPGEYQWRVRAENGSSQTNYTVRSFKVYPSILTNQIIQVLSPNNNFYVQNATIKLEWLGLFGALNYRLQIDNKSFINENNLFLDITTENLSFNKVLTQEGLYQYRIRAENTKENSKWSTIRTFTYDITPPSKVILNSPINKQQVVKPAQLSWDAISDAEKYELEIYKSDLTTNYNSSFPVVLTTNSYSFNLGEANETIAWRVRAIDKSGNKGPFSEIYTFIIK